MGLFRSIRKAHEILKKFDSKNDPQVQEVLALCQNCAMQIGNEVEYWEGEGTKTVRMLEDYCEEVYQCTQKSGSEYGLQISCVLSQKIQAVQNCFEQEIPEDKLEAVFFPYLASMWDSLASVWQAANEDEMCNAYVVPIPYFEKNPDGSFGEMHYEGGAFPKKVPTVHWEEYDIAKRYPDIVFIHNPYDENNFVTSVHPSYYSSVLKKFSDLLVYIPYYLFVNNAVSPHMLLTSAVLHADYVITQSVESGKKCIQIYDDFLAENGCKGLLKTGKQKFLPLGSPILDALQKPADEVPLPKEWQSIIRQKGNNPKIVMYNTHISDVMGPNAERFFCKLRSVLAKFRGQDRIVLLWRPHPLTWQTIRSMNPGAAKTYQEIVDGYRKEGWGIYDDTPDLNRSVALCDAYYGDWSSLITMFQEAGKPVLMQNLDIIG